MKYQTNKDLAESQYYLKILEEFCKTGNIEIHKMSQANMPWLQKEDPLLEFMVSVFNFETTYPSGEKIKQFAHQITNSKIKSKVFYDYVGKFIVECIHHQRFQRQRAWTEKHRAESIMDWSNFKRMDKDVWQSLLDQLETEHLNDGFDKPFFLRLFQGEGASKEENWERLIRDWRACIEHQVTNRVKYFIDRRKENFIEGLCKTMDQVTHHIKSNNVSEERAVQAWELMSGGWTETEFERRLNEMKIQDRYPAIQEIVAKMGRIADNYGKDRLTIASGIDMKMEHSAGSDIEGITIGDDLSSLLPSELAQYSDEDMEGLFIYKYRTRRLQTFRYKSEMSKPSRKLGFPHASRKGPMIVCIDTSASMYGTPERITSTLLSLLEETAEDLERDCYLIDFSVSIRAIDLMEKRKMKKLQKLGLQVTTSHLPFIGGSTNARKMLDAMFDLLDNDGLHYVNADILWITDFMIPHPPQSMLDRFKEYRETGTRFYGICIQHEQDKEENTWKEYFNEIYTIKYRPLRRY